MKKHIWVKGPKRPVKLDSRKKDSIINEVESFIENSDKLSNRVSHFEIRAGRVYFYHLVEQFGWNDPNLRFTVPLIDKKYIEFLYGRITIFIDECSLDWQRHNNKWVSVFTGTFAECLHFMNEQDEWFE